MKLLFWLKELVFGKKVNDHFEIPPQAKKYMMQKTIKPKIS